MGNPVLLVLACLLVAAPAAAGTVYRCVGQDGIPNYTSKRASNAVCKAIAHGTDQTRVSRSSKTAMPPPAAAAPVAPTLLEVEHKLASLRYDVGPIDGKVDDQTASAVTETSRPTVARRASTMLQPESEMRRVTASRGDCGCVV